MWLMLAVAAVASGAFWLRLASWAVAKLSLPFETAYALSAWLSWMLPLCLIYLVARSRAGGAAHRAVESHLGFRQLDGVPEEARARIVFAVQESLVGTDRGAPFRHLFSA